MRLKQAIQLLQHNQVKHIFHMLNSNLISVYHFDCYILFLHNYFV